MKYLFTTDKALLDYLHARPDSALVHAGVGMGSGFFREGNVTSFDSRARTLTLQTQTGEKHTFSWDWITIPQPHQPVITAPPVTLDL